jgi:peptidoglycan/LPS O-acetylase OafA/YrhL
MPRPIEPGRRYIAGLDGIRAIAVLCVIAFHLGVGWAKGGMLGVGVFFTLSGYLITDLLLSHWRRHGSLGLGTFWLRRARRLLPALFLMLIIVSVWVALFDAGQLASVRRQVISASLYFANWSTIAQHGSYFARFATPLPLDHLWSLSIEEQFYLIWPFVLLIGIWTLRNRLPLAILTLVAAGVSAVMMGQQFHVGYDPTRAYEGTDTRAFGLLIGAAVAMLWPTWAARRRVPAGVTNIFDVLGVLGFVVIVLLVTRTDSFTPFLYPIGFVLLSVATVAMVAAVVNPVSRLGPILGWTPLRWIGVRSYGIYLWQWPVIVLANPHQEPMTLPRAVLSVAATVLIASLSWRFVEDPIRRGALGRLFRQVRMGARRARRGAQRRTRALAGATAGAVALAILGLGGVLPAASEGLSSSGPVVKSLPKPLASSQASYVAGKQRARHAAPLPTPTKTSCRSVVYIGDSTSEGETSTDYIPNPRLRLPAQLARFGVATTYPEISGARSIIETFEGQPNAATVVRQHLSSGFNGCWILALGTNDVDNIHTGSTIGLPTRIAKMMSVIGHQPVLWIDVITLLDSGDYSESNMQEWNHSLVAACRRYPNMRVYDWAAHAKRKWFIPDGIHYYSPGYVARTHDIAQGLATAFPEGRPPAASCVVR